MAFDDSQRHGAFKRGSTGNSGSCAATGGQRSSPAYYFLPVPTSNLFKRALRRCAALRWMMPRLAALSIAEMSERTSLASGLAALRARFCMLRRRVVALRLRRVRRTFWRARLAADLVLAMIRKAVGEEARGAPDDCQDAGAPSLAPAIKPADGFARQPRFCSEDWGRLYESEPSSSMFPPQHAPLARPHSTV